MQSHHSARHPTIYVIAHFLLEGTMYIKKQITLCTHVHSYSPTSELCCEWDYRSKAGQACGGLHAKPQASPRPTPNPITVCDWHNSALLWQKEASDKSDISCNRAKCVCHFYWRQWNIVMSYLSNISLIKQDECWSIKYGLEEEDTRWNTKTSITQILIVCHLLPFAKVQQTCSGFIPKMSFSNL